VYSLWALGWNLNQKMILRRLKLREKGKETLLECLEHLSNAVDDFCFIVKEAIRDDIRSFKQKFRPIMDEVDGRKIYREVWRDDDYDANRDTDVCEWCDNDIDCKRMVWEPDTGNVYEFCPHCGYQLELVIDEDDLPKLSELEKFYDE
jgi:hypothetical protein